MYSLEYLPAARADLVGIVRYISRELENPGAARRLAERFAQAGERLAAFPYSAQAYVPPRPLGHEYRRLSVESYLMFYWVEEERQTVTVARVLYAGRGKFTLP